MRVIESGPAKSQPIVLVPGWCFTADIWHKQFAALGDRYRLVAFDPRSQGRSTILDHANSPDDRAEDISRLIAALHLQQPIIVGWSQGVQDVAAYALKFGTHDVGGLVLVDAAVSGGAEALDGKAAGEELGRMPIYASSPREYLQAMMPYVFRKPLSPNELSDIVSAGLRTPSSIGVANLTLDFFGKDYRRAFERIDVPTLLVVAGTAPDKDVQIRQPIPNATSVVVDGAGHAVFYDEPAKFNDALVRFVEARVADRAKR
ncbi:alpha/beta hydrolase [Dokdonella soli]|uniref:Alpha/beta hydrolase n=1 Tax=Dokdonella soli TaxID=529810 RepID=A0ABN1IDE3_9GAMM